ncbi:hypothetical protein EBZ39_02800 [bacterium]|nr:hypothetical protein [bacterium]
MQNFFRRLPFYCKQVALAVVLRKVAIVGNWADNVPCLDAEQTPLPFGFIDQALDELRGSRPTKPLKFGPLLYGKPSIGHGIDGNGNLSS